MPPVKRKSSAKRKTTKRNKTKRMVKSTSVDTVNILPEGRTRKRADFDYKERKTQTKIEKRTRSRISKNTLEKRQRTDEEKNNGSVSPIASNGSKGKSFTHGTTTTTGSDKSMSTPSMLFSEKIKKEVKRLGGTFPSEQLSSRSYRSLTYNIPINIQSFIDIQWPKNIKFKSKKYNLNELHFVEFDIEERQTIEWLKDHEDAILFGDAEEGIVATLMKEVDPSSKDFNIYVIHDTDEDSIVDGPHKLSEFLASLEKI